MQNHILAKLLGNTERTIHNWRNENRPVIRLIESNFNEDDIIKFLSEQKKPIKKKKPIAPLCSFFDDIGEMHEDFQEYLYHVVKVEILKLKLHKKDEIG